MVLAFVGIAVAGVYLKFDRPVAYEDRIGVLESLHQIQGNTGSSHSEFYVRLSNGEIVNVTAPAYTPFVKGREVRVVRSTTEAGRIGYAFGGYVDSASNTTVERDARKSGARLSP
jgi:hypothetical protein